MGKIIEVNKVLNNFLNGFIPAYIGGRVPLNAHFPYLTYSFDYVSNYEETPLQLKIYSKDSSTLEVLGIIENLEKAIGNGLLINLCSGSLWIKKGEPFYQLLSSEEKTINSAYVLLKINILT